MATPLRHVNICIRGEVFPTIRAAAAHFGVTYHAVKFALMAGKLDRVGLGIGRPARPMRVRIRDLVFEDCEAAGRHFGLKASTIRTAVWRGNADRIGLPRRFPGNVKPCVIHGLAFPSRTAACRALGLSHGFLWHLEHGGGPPARETLLLAVMAYRARQDAAGPSAAAMTVSADTGSQSGRGKTRAVRAEGAGAWGSQQAA